LSRLTFASVAFVLLLLFTLDYEIHGNGEGSPRELMVEPTDRLMDLLEAYGAKLTIMADVAEIIRFRDYRDATGRDQFHYQAIIQQLQRAVRNGHDVQLHIHSSYFNAEAQDGRWKQDWSEYNFAGLPRERMHWMVGHCKEFLESILKPVSARYECLAFRAANWAASPSANVVASLTAHGIKIETSVFRFGRRSGLVNFDYTSTPHALGPWRASAQNICQEDFSSSLWEFPIYAEKRSVGSFLTLNRCYRALQSRLHRFSDAPQTTATAAGAKRGQPWTWLLKKHAWKADFNQCSGRQLIRGLQNAEGEAEAVQTCPFVLIGHSKLFTRWNALSLRPLLRFVKANPDRFGFGTFRHFGNRIPDLAFGRETSPLRR
jgi:hypothetical protein